MGGRRCGRARTWRACLVARGVRAAPALRRSCWRTTRGAGGAATHGPGAPAWWRGAWALHRYSGGLHAEDPAGVHVATWRNACAYWRRWGVGRRSGRQIARGQIGTLVLPRVLPELETCGQSFGSRGPVPHAPACCVVHTHSVTVPHLLRGKSSCEGRLWVVRWFARAARVHKPVAPARPTVACRRFARASASAGAGAFMPRGTGQATEGLGAPRQGRLEGRKAGWWKCDVFHSYFSSNKQYCQLEKKKT